MTVQLRLTFDGAKPLTSQLASIDMDDPADPPQLHLVRRGCDVCDWEGVQLERGDTPIGCPWCHAPTHATVIISHVEGLTTDARKNPHAAALGRLGGLKGGPARAEALTAKRRREIAQGAAKARWGAKKSRKKR